MSDVRGIEWEKKSCSVSLVGVLSLEAATERGMQGEVFRRMLCTTTLARLESVRAAKVKSMVQYLFDEERCSDVQEA